MMPEALPILMVFRCGSKLKHSSTAFHFLCRNLFPCVDNYVIVSGPEKCAAFPLLEPWVFGLHGKLYQNQSSGCLFITLFIALLSLTRDIHPYKLSKKICCQSRTQTKRPCLQVKCRQGPQLSTLTKKFKMPTV